MSYEGAVVDENKGIEQCERKTTGCVGWLHGGVCTHESEVNQRKKQRRNSMSGVRDRGERRRVVGDRSCWRLPTVMTSRGEREYARTCCQRGLVGSQPGTRRRHKCLLHSRRQRRAGSLGS